MTAIAETSALRIIAALPGDAPRSHNTSHAALVELIAATDAYMASNPRTWPEANRRWLAAWAGARQVAKRAPEELQTTTTGAP